MYLDCDLGQMIHLMMREDRLGLLRIYYKTVSIYSLMPKLALVRLLEDQTNVLINLPPCLPARPVCISTIGLISPRLLCID